MFTDLGPGAATDINEQGQVAGGNANGPWSWYRGQSTYLDTGPAQYVRVRAMNDAGWAVGVGAIEASTR